ncbi:MAG: prepilin-type N-terminal cleavage/methylation domain-containing protein [Opitutae bacterium]|nr:prepilin-type N-terminal cleavage/methylation domain-containing protein [Opitutae bacterium]
MASTTTSTTAPERAARGRRAFTLVEVLIGASIGSFVLLGILSTFLMLGRSGVSLNNYSAMDAQTRKGLEDFAQDVRMASAITFNSTTSITLTVPDNYTSTSNQVTYAWDTTTGSLTYHYFYRVPGTAAATSPKTTYIANVAAFSFLRYDRLNVAATTDAATKRIQISMTVSTANRTVVTATDTTISASYILRNKTSS